MSDFSALFDFSSIGIVLDPRFALHHTPFQHPESPKRTDSIVQKLAQSPIFQSLTLVLPRFATESDLLRCHLPEYIQLVEDETSKCPPLEIHNLSTGDVQISSASFDIAKLAAGAVLSAIDVVMNGELKSVFCIVRPPGHHATTAAGMGFCLFNNVAIGAFYALKTFPISRVLIVDWDVHHGNGTQDIVQNDPRIFYFSTHEYPLYPGTGHPDERGVGNVTNIPIYAGPDSREQLLSAYRHKLPKLMDEFKPELILISAGFDAHKQDPLGHLNLEAADFAELTDIVKSIANKYAQGRIVSVLEGGYNLEALAESAFAHVQALAQKE